MALHKFIEFVGGCWLRGMCVAAYRVDDETVQLRVETVGGKICAMVRNVPVAEFDRLKREWSAGIIGARDGRVTDRALHYFFSI